MELGWTMLVLIPNGDVDTRNIGLLEVVCKVMEMVIDNRINLVVQFHDVLHGFCAGRGTGTTIMELKLAQYLSNVEQDPLFLVFLELMKAHDNLDRGRLLQTLEVYGETPNL